MSASVRTVDRGANALKARLKARAKSVEVGVIGVKAGELEAEGSSALDVVKSLFGARSTRAAVRSWAAGGVTVADVATWAEYGLGQPQRSWLRDWIEENQAQVETAMRAESDAVLKGTRSKAQALARLGLWIQGAIQERIAAGIEPPNADSTIDRKGSSKPLIDKGQFRSSISSRVTE